MQALTRKASFWGLGGLIAQGINLLAVALTAHAVSQATFGTYRQMVLLHGLLTILFLYSLGSAVLHFVQGHADTGLARRIFGLQLTLGAIASLILLVASPLFARWFNNPDLTESLRVFSPYPLLIAVGISVPLLIHSLGRERAAGASLVIQPAAVALGLSVAAFTAGSSVAIAAGMVIGAGVGAVLTYFLAGFRLGTSVTPKVRGESRHFLAFALPLGFAAGTTLLGYQIDQLMVAALTTPTVYAVYAAGAIEVPLVKLVRDSVAVSAMPALVTALRAGDRETFRGLWARSIELVALVVLPLAVTFWIAAPWIIGLLFGVGYTDAILFFRLYLLAIPARLFWHEGVLMATGRTRPAIALTAVFAALNLALNAIGWWLIGIEALPVATAISVAVSAVLFAIVGARQLNLPLRDVLPIRSVIPGVVASVVVLAALLAGRAVIDVTGIVSNILVIGGIAGGSWLVVAGIYFRTHRSESD
jgi:O-antigen/teichoic acid export membrane protein